MGFAALAAIWAVHLMAAISPGPAVLMAARTGLAEGPRRGAALGVGLALGACVWAAAAMFGLKTLFDHAPGLLRALRLVGAAYLFYLAVKMWRHAAEPLSLQGAVARGGYGWLVWRGIATQMANPKPAVFFGAVFASLLPAQAPGWVWATILVLVFLNEFLWNALVARAFGVARVRAGYLRLKAGVDRTLGAAMAALGLKLALG